MEEQLRKTNIVDKWNEYIYEQLISIEETEKACKTGLFQESQYANTANEQTQLQYNYFKKLLSELITLLDNIRPKIPKEEYLKDRIALKMIEDQSQTPQGLIHKTTNHITKTSTFTPNSRYYESLDTLSTIREKITHYLKEMLFPSDDGKPSSMDPKGKEEVVF